MSLGGDAGVRPERVAGQLNTALDEVSSRLAQLAAAGVVMERTNAAVSVQPAPMRWVLVRRSFFGGAGSLNLTPFLSLVENAHCAIDTLIGARARGASVPDLETYLEQADSERLWASYAAIGPSEARHVIRRHPERVLTVAETGLHSAPELVIPLLLDCLRDRGSMQRSDSENPLAILNRWATEVFPRNRESIRRRSILLDTAMNWWRERRDARTALRVMCIALQPGFSFLASNPGNELSGRFIQGHLGDQDMETLAACWPTVKDVLQDSTDVPWDSLLQLVSAWHYLYPSSLTDIKISAATRTIAEQFAERMLRDLAYASQHSSGVQHEIKEIGARFGVELQTTTDGDFEDLYVSEDVVDQERDAELVPRWSHRSVEAIAASLARVESEAKAAGIAFPPWRCHVMCGRLAQALPNPAGAANAFMKQKLPGSLVEPFLREAARNGRPEWESIVRRCLRDERYREIGFTAVISHPAPPEEVLSVAFANAGDTGNLIEACFYRGLIPGTTTRTMLQCHDPRVAVSAAIGHWRAVAQENRDGTLDEAWRRAILRAPGGKVGRSAHDLYWIRKIMSADSRLAEEWLLLKFGERGDLHFWVVEDAVTKIVPTLDVERRLRVLLGLRPDSWNDDLVKLLVGDDDETYGKLLDTEDLAPFHLAPLAGKPDEKGWRAKALQALDKGIETDKIARATLGTSHGWSGLESEMWAGWRRAFEALLDDADRGIARIGERGAELVKEDELRALAGERYRAVHGR